VNPALLRKRISKGAAAARHPVYRGGLRHGVLAAVEHEAILRGLAPIGTVLDVGANVGQFALVARRTFPDAAIISFEPLPQARERMQRVFADDPAFDCVPAAVAATGGEARFHVTSADDSSSLLPVADRQVEEFPGTSESFTLDVPTVRLDDALAERELRGPILLKADTQGTELEVLRSAGELLGRISHVLVEASFVELYRGQADAADLIAWLGDQGWALRGVYDVKTSRRTGVPLQADLLFQPKAGGAGS
jgi:FkbM family methyltransferase